MIHVVYTQHSEGHAIEHVCAFESLDGYYTDAIIGDIAFTFDLKGADIEVVRIQDESAGGIPDRTA